MSDAVPVIIDTDPGVDDALALLFAAASPELDLLAVTTVAGNVAVDLAAENASRILTVAWREGPPPLHRGEAAASETAELVHGADGLGGASALRDHAGRPLYPPAAPISRMGAVDAILGLAASRPGEVTLVTLGPLTNLAAAIRRDPRRVRLLKRVVIMGGAFRVPGNVTAEAEFNVHADPEAAQVVCDSGLHLTWVPLDVTEQCVLTEEHLARLGDRPALRFARHAAESCLLFHEEYYGRRFAFLHDPLALATVIRPDLVRSTPLRVDVEIEGVLTRGRTVADFRTRRFHRDVVPNAWVCLSVDAARFGELFLSRIASL